MVREHEDTRPVLVIVGPTAVGKTAVGVEIAEQHGWEIVSADSRQVYKKLDIGTAKPSSEDRRRAAHHLIDVVEPWEVYSCGKFRIGATDAIQSIRERGKTPVVVGGSGLYLSALEKGLFDGPERNAKLRAELRRLVEEQGSGMLHKRLAQLDPVTAKRLHPNDVERVIRAIEVFEATGKSISELQRDSTKPGRFRLIMVGLRRPRETLYEMINHRFELMLERGFLDELRSLLEIGFSEEWPAFRTVGYREMVAYLRGRVSLDSAKETAKTQTRRFAKRQTTWLNNSTSVTWIDVATGEDSCKTAEKVLCVFETAAASNTT